MPRLRQPTLNIIRRAFDKIVIGDGGDPSKSVRTLSAIQVFSLFYCRGCKFCCIFCDIHVYILIY